MELSWKGGNSALLTVRLEDGKSDDVQSFAIRPDQSVYDGSDGVVWERSK